MVLQVVWGGVAMRGTVLLVLPGEGCSRLKPKAFDRLVDFAERHRARLTGIHVAVDYFNGEHTWSEARATYYSDPKAYRPKLGGRTPKAKSIVAEGDGEAGSTFYVGKLGSGKLLRVYEKGKQLGDLTSPWNRAEIAYGAKGRELPLWLLRPGYWLDLWAHAYPELERWSEGGASPISLPTRAVARELAFETFVDGKVAWLRRTAGPMIAHLSTVLTPKELVNLLAVDGTWKALERHCDDPRALDAMCAVHARTSLAPLLPSQAAAVRESASASNPGGRGAASVAQGPGARVHRGPSPLALPSRADRMREGLRQLALMLHGSGLPART
jgi:DNA relaxase NicK